MNQSSPHNGKARQKPHNGGDVLRKTRLLAQWALIWERFWPLALPFICVVSLFLTVSWLGIWSMVPDTTRLMLLALFAVAAVYCLSHLRKFSWPGSSQINGRIEKLSNLAHRPVSAQNDHQASVSGSDDPFARALWNEHQQRMAGSLKDLKAGTPVPKVAQSDPFALRSLVGLLLFVGVAAGWGEWSSRVGDAFRSHTQTTALVQGRVDAWLKPPAYTNRPPIFLTGQTASVTAPEGSELVVRVLDIDTPVLFVSGSGDDQKKQQIEPQTDSGEGSKPAQPQTSRTVNSFNYELKRSGTISLASGEAKETYRTWQITVVPDNDPTIRFVDAPEGSSRGALEFSYEVQDDYGITAARADIRSTTKSEQNKAPLIEPPKINLPLPSLRAREGTSKTSQDLTAHPWAGAEVSMTLVVEDDAKQVGRSETKSFKLPERVFTKPLALAVVEERRRLALDAGVATQVAEMLDIMTNTHPEEFIPNVTTYTALRVVYRTIKRAESDDELREAVALMWEIALAIEDGDLSLAERRLRDAQERLAQALENGASDAEIDELMKELRAAMENFMQELAEQMQRNQQNQQAMPLDPNTQVLRQQDLERMMQQIEDLAKSGSKDAARQLLEEMQRMMNNLQTAQPGQQQQQTDEFSQQMNKLGEMMRQQQQLMDQTFEMQRQQQQQNGNRQGQPGLQDQRRQQQNRSGQQGQQREGQSQQGGQQPMTAEEFAEAMKELQRQQGELQRQMQEMQDALRDLGMEPGEKLGEAGEAMGEAEQQLGQGESGQATGQQGRALQAMREGAQQMMQNMQNQAGEQGRRGERGQHGQQSRGERDPLGRQSQSRGPQLGNDTKVPGEIDAQRAREILDAIRRRLGESTRPKLELDYLDRLLPTR